MNSIKKILSSHFPNHQWRIEKSPAGLSKESYVATSENRKLFIKYDVKTPALKRLAKIRATPPIKVIDSFDGRPYIIQEYVEGKYPNRKWFSENITTLAKFTRRYQNDKLLKNILPKGSAKLYKDHIKNEIHILDTAVKSANSDLFRENKFRKSFELLRKQAIKLNPNPLVPIHADPNYKNILLTDRGITMIDWDDIILSDPMRDVGLLLWWYIPRNKWQRFFNEYGSVMDSNKIFWWVAKRSLAIALWFDKRKDEKEVMNCLEDFYAALSKKDNPKMNLNSVNPSGFRP